MNQQPTQEPETKKKNHKGLKIVAISTLLLLLAGAVAYSVYVWGQNSNLRADLESKNALISEASRNKSPQEEADSFVPPHTESAISIKELGISITLPSTISDLTYSYSSSIKDNKTIRSVSFSTQKLTDAYANTKECAASGVAPPLGTIHKVEGVYPKNANHSTTNGTGTLVRQFDVYYVSFSAPQSLCAQSQKEVPTELSEFRSSLSSIEELY